MNGASPWGALVAVGVLALLAADSRAAMGQQQPLPPPRPAELRPAPAGPPPQPASPIGSEGEGQTCLSKLAAGGARAEIRDGSGR